MVKYYYAGSQRVAMRKGNPGTVSFLLGDHLGSTSLTTNSSGGKVAELRYHPWGGTRFTSGTTPTSYQFTGQRNDYYIKLYHMGARMYDPELGRFISPDSIIPNPANPQSLNRYSYVYNSPLKFHDPSGHAPKWVDFIVGVTYQVANDMSYGAFNAVLSLTVDAFWDTRQGEGFYAGQQVGRNLSQAIGGTLVINGVATAATGAAAMGPTAGGSLAAAPLSGGTSIVVGGIALSAEAGMVIGGTAEAAYGLGIIAYTKLNPLPEGTTSSNRTYAPSPKHVQGGWGSPMDLSDEAAQGVLNNGIQHGKQVYGYYEGKIYTFQPDNSGTFHGYQTSSAPTRVLRTWRREGLITNSQYKDFLHAQ